GSKRLFQCAADLLGNRSLDTHPFDEEVVSLVLLDGVLGGKAMKGVVPDSVGNQLITRREPKVGCVDGELTWIHVILSPVEPLASNRCSWARQRSLPSSPD